MSDNVYLGNPNLKKANTQLRKSQGPPSSQSSGDTQEYFDYIDKQLKEVKGIAEASHPGSTDFLVTVYMYGGYTDRKGSNNSFEAGLNPILLWKIADRLFVQSELEIVLPQDDPTSEGEFNLEFANLAYQICDYSTIGIGKFLTPFGFFPQHIHPTWINKLPDKPIPLEEDNGLVPYQQLGFFVRGGIPVLDNSKIKYDVYVSNGPTLRTASYAEDAAGLGTLDASNNGDLNNNKAVGARLGFLPFPQMEFDYSVMNSQVSPDGSQKLHALLQAISLNYKKQLDCLSGTVDLMTEYFWWNMGSMTYDSGGSFGGPFMYQNNRRGGYAQVAYRPTMLDDKVLKNIEGVYRYDWVDEPATNPNRNNDRRNTVGLNYWVSPSTVLKAAYEFDDNSGGPNANAFMFQAAVGF